MMCSYAMMIEYFWPLQSVVSPLPAAADGSEHVRWPEPHQAGLWESKCGLFVQSTAPKGNIYWAHISKWLKCLFCTLFILVNSLQREEFPLLQVVDLLSVVRQVCEVLTYLHGRSLVLRALSSHTVLIVHPGVAKVTGLGFMVPRYLPPKDIF